MASSSRHDGRRHNEMRKITISYDGLSRADGSARFGFGTTSALSSFSGPIEVRLAAEQASQATFEVLVRPLSRVPATQSKSLASSIRSALIPSLILTKNPRTLFQLVIQELSSTPNPIWRDSQIAAMINASALAMLNAGSVPLRGVVCAVSIGRTNTTGSDQMIDPDDEEIASLVQGGCFAFLFGAGSSGTIDSECVWTNWKSTSACTNDVDFATARNLARTAASSVYELMKESIASLHVEQSAGLDVDMAEDSGNAGKAQKVDEMVL